ncbi:MAG: UbiA family prenyltransferase [Sphingosinicella sp.]
MHSLRHFGPYWLHLRLAFQLNFVPIYLWGVLLAGGVAPGAARGFWLGLVALHLFLNPGITAFNAVYDRDVGPVSGLEKPPPVPAHLLAFALALQTVGAVLAAFVGATFLLLYFAIAAIGAGYSHPAIRWKKGPWTGAAAVSAGQGALSFLAGWAASGHALAMADLLWLGAAGCALAILGLYPATQAFQTKEDEARGDRTLAVHLGPARALRLGSLALAAAGGATAAAAWLALTPLDGGLVAAAFAAAILLNERLRTSIGTGSGAYRRAMNAIHVLALPMLGWMAWRLFGSG